MRPAVLAVDSVQTVHSSSLESMPGIARAGARGGRAPADVRQDASGVPVVLVGHVTKDGALAGPKTLEHVVDCVLYFEGERTHTLSHPAHAPRTASARPTRSASSRCAPRGWARCPIRRRCSWPSGRSARPARWWSRRSRARGRSSSRSRRWWRTRRACRGARRSASIPIACRSSLAVIERRAGIDVLGQDVFVNVAGGVRLSSRRAISACWRRWPRRRAAAPVDPHTLCFGEVGLGGRGARGRRRRAAPVRGEEARLPSLRPARAVALAAHRQAGARARRRARRRAPRSRRCSAKNTSRADRWSPVSDGASCADPIGARRARAYDSSRATHGGDDACIYLGCVGIRFGRRRLR